MPRPVVSVGSLGGTITMTRDDAATEEAGDPGVRPRLRAEDLVAAVPGLAGIADVSAATLATLPGASLGPPDLVRAWSWANEQVDAGSAGVVLVQGTDTLEESAWLLELWWDREEPLVLTGAMRPPQAAGADGPANLLTAVTAAAAPAARGAGCLVAMGAELHAATRVRKVHASDPQAFASPDTGPVGRVQEGEVHLRRRHRFAPLPAPDPLGRPVRVALLETHLFDDGSLLREVAEAGYDAVVVAGFGAGHVSESCARVVSEVSDLLPVVVATRTGGGSTLRDTYAFVGSERDLRTRGALLAGWLDARRSRALAWAVLSAGRSREDLARELDQRGGGPE